MTPALRVLASGSVCRSTLCPPLDERTQSIPCLLPWMRGRRTHLGHTRPAVADRLAPTTTDAAGGINQRNGLGFTGGECDSAPRPPLWSRASCRSIRACSPASPRHPIAPFQRPRVDGATSIGPDPPPRTAERRGAARVMAALGRVLREDGREEGTRFHVRCARAGGESVGVRKVDGSTVGKFAGT